MDERIVERWLNYAYSTRANRAGLNHGLLATYQQYDYCSEMRAGWDALGEYLVALGPMPWPIATPGEVVVANDDYEPARIVAL